MAFNGLGRNPQVQMQTNIKAQSLRYDIGNTHGNDSLRLNQVDWGHHAAAKSLQSCLTLCDPIDGSPPGSPVPGILQARTLEWVAISFSNAWKWKVKVKSLSCIWLFVMPWTAAHQASLLVGFSRQESWSGGPLPSPEDIICIYYCHIFHISQDAPGNSKRHSQIF